MEGSCIRSFPRTLAEIPIELLVGDKTIRTNKARGNLSPGGLFVEGQDLPVGTPVRVRIDGASPFEAEGVVRYCELVNGRGVGIEFTAVTQANRKRLDQLLAELTEKGLPVC